MNLYKLKELPISRRRILTKFLEIHTQPDVNIVFREALRFFFKYLNELCFFRNKPSALEIIVPQILKGSIYRVL